MAKLTDKSTFKCGLGAIQTVHAIDGVLPILHAGPGCAVKVGGGQDLGGSGHYASQIFPCTNLSEKEIVFGGEGILKKTIENAQKVIDADLYVVLTSCASEIIGDDSENVAGKFAQQGDPVIHVSTAGFKGNNYLAHDWVLTSIYDQYLKTDKPTSDQIIKGQVNVFASLPQHDPFWHGNYDVLEDLLLDIGLKPNIIFGHGRGIKNVDKIPYAEFNLVVNPWVGLESVQFLEEKFGTPFFHYPNLPVGAYETTKFLLAVAEYAGLDLEPIREYTEKNERKYYYFIERFANTLLEQRIMAKRFTVVADAQYSLAFTRYLVNDFGINPQKQYATEDVPEKHRDNIRELFQDLNTDYDAEISFETDGFKIHEEIKQEDYLGYPLIIGSAWEKPISAEVDAYYLNVTWPINERLVINSSYVGYDGGLNLLEDIYSEVLQRYE
ncbi:MAG: hydrogenase [Clostridiales Family XIII bacterium]|jgi:nitrogenase molybdenum-iron protein beta chain|nr:hydrogenase [Clostridiales Family XIII bacterium]